jgi:hypothetical protein
VPTETRSGSLTDPGCGGILGRDGDPDQALREPEALQHGVQPVHHVARDLRARARGARHLPIVLSQILVDDQKENRDRDGAVSGTLLAELIQRGGDALYSLVRRGVGDVETNLNEMRDNVKRWIRTPGDVAKFDAADLRETVHNAVERVLRVADLPTRGDLEALNKNLERLAAALESFEARLTALDASRERTL